ncbi:autotransporter-associated beta strand repeat-containing protein [Botrimarina sp.]|uniref:pectate lyase family protein n=1 Tax=Botrimarina sp. TaxID=2795802 RepID=UPI0032EE85B5
MLRVRLTCGAWLALVLSGSTHAATPAFPGAEGFGAMATGARTNLSAASVYHVTNLNDAGPGSFRDAVSEPNRFVVFDVGGIVNLQSVVPVASNITIAGQTAPGGFTLYNDRISFTGSDNLISRHFAVRKGQPGVRTDAASIARGANMIFDHMSITWGVDGTFDINADSGHVIDNITIQNSIIAQGLDRLGHSTGGLMQPGTGGSVSVIKSLWADNVTRNPKVRNENEFINNVVYGWESAGYIMGDTAGSSIANVEGNYFIEGPVDASSPFSGGTSAFRIFPQDNWVDANRDGALNGSPVTSYPGATVVADRHAFPTTPTLTAEQAVAHVMANAGPSIVRDAVDTRLMQEVASYGTLGGVILRETDLFPGFGADPVYLNPRARFADADADGIADTWEASRGLNPSHAGDWKGLSPAGYTWLEEYVNELGAAGANRVAATGEWSAAATWGGSAPTLADEAVVAGAVTSAGGHAFARRLGIDGTLHVTGGSVSVFDTLSVAGAAGIEGATAQAGRVLLGPAGQPATATVAGGGVLRTGTVAGGPAARLRFDGGVFQAAGPVEIAVATTLEERGAQIDTNGHSGAVTGAVSGVGGLTKRGAGSLTLSGANAYRGPTVVEQGELVALGGGLGQSGDFVVHAGATLDATAAGGGLRVPSGGTLNGMGTIRGAVTAADGALVAPRGTLSPTTDVVGVQAESLTLGVDWEVFDNSAHGAGAGGSYDGADLNGGGIVLVSGESLSSPSADGFAATTIDLPAAGGWLLYAKTAEPSNSPIAGEPSPTQGGNNSLWVSGAARSVNTTGANFEEVQTLGAPGDEATWTLLSPSVAPLEGVRSALNAGIDYTLSAGEQAFAVYGREVGTIVDGFVLAARNLTAAELETALSQAASGGAETVLTVDGDYTHGAGAMLHIELDGPDSLSKLRVSGTADLAGDLSISLGEGFLPPPTAVFEALDAGALRGRFANAADGSRLMTNDGAGSFLVGYDTASGLVTLSDFAVVPEPTALALMLTGAAAGAARRR